MPKRKSTTRGNKRTPLQQGQLQRVPRPRVGFDGSKVRVVTTFGMTTAILNQADSIFSLDTSVTGAVQTYTGLLNSYAEYRFLDMTVTWIPAVAPGAAAAGGSGYIATYFNPEQMVALYGMTIPQVVQATKTTRDFKPFNVWEKFTYNVPMFKRRPWFDCNSNILTNVDVFDRSVQALVVAGFDTIGATDSIGRFSIKATLEVRQLNNIST